MATNTKSPLGQSDSVCDHYLQDDVARGLRASLVTVLTSALPCDRSNFDFLRGVFSLARSQAALYGISWPDLVMSLCEVPGLHCLVQELQHGVYLGQYVAAARAISSSLVEAQA